MALPQGILVVGDINVDVLGCLDTLTTLGGDFLAPELEFHCGGVGANTALALARWRVLVRLLGCTGRDWFGEFALRCLRSAKVDVSLVRQLEGMATGLMFIAVSPDGQRTIFGSRGANAHLRPPDVNWQCLQGITGLHLLGYNFLSPTTADTAWHLLEEARRRGTWVSLDAGMAPSYRIPETILQVARQADILFVSRDEAVALTREGNPARAVHALEQAGVRLPLVKLGEQGCLFLEGGEVHEVPAFAVRVTDSTGAGDAFAAAFLCARLRRWPDAEAVLLANAAGAVAASALGAGDRMPEPSAIQSRLAESCLPAEWEPVRIQLLKRLEHELGFAAPDTAEGGQNGIQT